MKRRKKSNNLTILNKKKKGDSFTSVRQKRKVHIRFVTYKMQKIVLYIFFFMFSAFSGKSYSDWLQPVLPMPITQQARAILGMSTSSSAASKDQHARICDHCGKMKL